MAAGEKTPVPRLQQREENTDQNRAKYTRPVPCGPMSIEEESHVLPGGYAGGQAMRETPLTPQEKAARGH